MRVSDDLVRILVEGKYRARLSEMEDDGSFLLATVRPAPVKMAKLRSCRRRTSSSATSKRALTICWL